MSTSTLVVLRLIHILIGIGWAGCILFVAGFLMPAVHKLGPAGGPVMVEIMSVKKLPLYLMGGVILTILSGIGLYWFDSAGFTSRVWMDSHQGRVLGLGGVLVIIVAIIGATVNSPTAMRMGQLGDEMQKAGGPPSAAQLAELDRLRNRLKTAVNTTAVLIIVAIVCMAVARYV